MSEPRMDPNTEAGDYIEDDPQAWEQWLATVRRYVPDYPALVAHLAGKEDAAAEIIAGTMLSYLADRFGIFLVRGDAERVTAPDPVATATGYVPGMAFGTGGNNLGRRMVNDLHDDPHGPHVHRGRWCPTCLVIAHDLREYARHESGCAFQGAAGPRCDCGFDQLLERYDRLSAE